MSLAGGQRLTEDDLVDVGRGDAGAVEDLLDGNGTEIGGGEGGERAQEVACKERESYAWNIFSSN